MLTKHFPNPFPAHFRSVVSFVFGLLFRNNARAVEDFEHVQRILFVNLGHIGDGIMSFGAAARLRRAFPRAHIAGLFGPWGAAVAQRSGLFDEIVPYAGGAWRRRHPDMVRPGATSALWRRRGSRRFDLIVSLHADMRTLFCEMLFRPRYRVDLGATRVAKKLGLTGPGGDGHLCADFDLLLRQLGIADGGEKPILSMAEDDFASLPPDAKDVFRTGGRVVVVHPFGAYSEKEWAAENYAAVIDDLSRSPGVAVVVTGAAGDGAKLRALRSTCSSGFVDVVGRTSFPGLGALIERADLMITGDGGPMHLAAAVGTPVVALFGPTDPVRWGPVCDRAEILYHATDCGRCNRAPACIRVPRCIDRISVAETVAAARRLLAGGKG
jgi:ADP-heptose:LPS heptosyltransferase